MRNDDELAAELRQAEWRKASYSGADGGDCIEVAPLSGDRVGIRDTEQPELAPWVVRGSVFRAFVSGAKDGEFDF
ncbi:DUF397 domain-containing protein [Actinomadura sp. ATCC 31491]|uniref:DUF397 domain-containing protein n=1 Tax=Actinomadura luzonensis TaxID=2805427 RepID=A0ABT0G634_9ACTN|nr:DUF397 domain-containing protein [Actinomadura luzonensis]MCK2219553.1 DUF397 domain-containing protein [Actinomadura luzonensis]